jgi:hypothetical protein
MRTRPNLGALAAVVALSLATACAMRITGTVRDATSGQPIGGAVLSANDGRSRLSTTDPTGGYAVKTNRRPTNLTVSAPGYETTTVVVSDAYRYPIVDVDLTRAFPAPGAAPQTGGAPLVAPLQAGGTTGAQSTEARLQELQQLHARGVISDEEYRKMRARVVAGH